MAEDLGIDKSRTALVVIDLQKGIASRETHPHDVKTVVSNAARLAQAFRRNGMPVFLVHVDSEAERLHAISDEAFHMPDRLPDDWSEFVPEIGRAPSDIVITKRQWGAFYGTDLELRLRRRSVTTIVLCGIATNYGVESTARFAYEYGFEQVFAEDAMSSLSSEMHEASIRYALRRMGRVRKTSEILAGIA